MTRRDTHRHTFTHAHTCTHMHTRKHTKPLSEREGLAAWRASAMGRGPGKETGQSCLPGSRDGPRALRQWGSLPGQPLSALRNWGSAAIPPRTCPISPEAVGVQSEFPAPVSSSLDSLSFLLQTASDPALFWRRAWRPTPAVLPGGSHGQGKLVGYSPGVAESDTTE